MIIIAGLGLLVGVFCGMLIMSLFAVNAYDKGFRMEKTANKNPQVSRNPREKINNRLADAMDAYL